MKVKCSLYFRGRENAHRDLGFDVMNRVLKECAENAQADMTPKLIGNSIVMVLGPRAGKPVTRADGHAPAGERPAGFQNPVSIPVIKPAVVPVPVSTPTQG